MADDDEVELHWVRAQIEALEQQRVSGGQFGAVEERRLKELHKRETELLATRHRSSEA